MKFSLKQLVGLLCAALVFSATAVYGARQTAVNSGGELPAAQWETSLEQENASSEIDYSDYSFEGVYVDASSSQTEESQAESSAREENLIQNEVSAPVEAKPASPENNAIEQDLQGTTNADTRPSTGVEGPPLDDTPDEPVSSEPESSESGETSQTPGTAERNPLEEKVNMPAYTPYGKALTIQVGGVNYKADAVVVVSSMVQAEIVGTNTDASRYPYYHEAYKAQAVACHSFVKSYNNRGSIPTNIYVKTPSAATVRLVEQVIGEMVYYNGSVAETLYHASSGLHTQGAQYVWGGYIPYLTGVVSKYDEEPSVVTYSVEEVRSKLSANGYDTSLDPAEWFVIQSYTDGNFIDDIKICGKAKTGNTLKNLMGLRSGKAQISFNGTTFTFSVNGWGHGVGMSQVGALGYSRYDGWSYRQILTHYYPGCTVT